MALFAPPNFYQSQNISAAATSNYFPQTFNNIIPPSPSNSNTTHYNSHHQHPTDSVAMKRRRENDESEPLPKRPHYEERMAQRFNSIDLSNENPPVSPIDIMDDELEINEVDPEILDGDPQPFSDDFEEEPIIEEPDDEDRIVLSDELYRYMKNANEHNILSKFHKKPSGNELILWRPISNPLSSSASSMNDRITEVNDDEIVDDGISDAMRENLVTFPEESSSSARSSCSPPKIAENDAAAISSSSSCCSSDGNGPSRMPSTNFSILQNQPDYEPMEMD